MTHLQHVNGRQGAVADEGCLDRSLGIAGQERGESAVPEQHHDGAVVDVAFGERGCRIGLARVQHLDGRGRIERERLAGASDCRVHRRLGGCVREEVVVRRVVEGDPGM